MFRTRTFAPAVALLSALTCASPSFAAIWNVSTTTSLASAINSAATGDEIVVASGIYNLYGVLRMDTPGVTLRGATGNRDDVVLVGGGVANHVEPRSIIFVEDEDITIKDLTVSEAYWNGIHLRGETNKVKNTLISNVKIENIGQRYIKGSKGSITNEVSNVIIENSYLLQSKDYVQQPGELNDYIGGIDAMVTKDWIIRDNVFEGIQGEDGEGRGAIFLWQGGERATIERNVFINNDRSIALGNWSSGHARNDGIYDMDGAIIRNNMVLRYPGGDIGMELVHTKDVKVYNNTLYSQDANKSRMFLIMDQGTGTATATTGLDIQNNIIRGRISDNGAGDWNVATVEAMGNLVDQTGTEILESWFVDAQNGDLHLTELATGAIGLAPRISTVLEDLDGDARPDPTDFGADQFAPIPGDFDRNGSD